MFQVYIELSHFPLMRNTHATLTQHSRNTHVTLTQHSRNTQKCMLRKVLRKHWYWNCDKITKVLDEKQLSYKRKRVFCFKMRPLLTEILLQGRNLYTQHTKNINYGVLNRYMQMTIISPTALLAAFNTTLLIFWIQQNILYALTH